MTIEHMSGNVTEIAIPRCRHPDELPDVESVLADTDDDLDYDHDLLILFDAVGSEREAAPPYLVFDAFEGRIVIADDCEDGTYDTARDFVLTREDAIELAHKLLEYAMTGETATYGMNKKSDLKPAAAAKVAKS